jgi:hypothetical protein
MTTRRNNSRKFRKTYKRGVRRGVRRGGEGERIANDFTEEEEDFIRKLRGEGESKKRDPMNVSSSTWDKWDKFQKNRFNPNNEHLRPVKGGKTKRKMRKHRK